MKRFIFTLTALLAALSFVSVKSSEAASITSLSVYSGTDYGSGAYTTAYLSADADISYINWYVNGSYELASMHSHGARSVSVSLYARTGHIKGIKYTIEAIAWFWDDATQQWSSDSSSDVVRVYKPIQTSGTGAKTGASGTAEVSAHYFNGSSFVMSASTYAYNRTDRRLRVHAWFRQRRYVNGGVDWEGRDTKSPVEITRNSSSSASPDSSIVDYRLRRRIGRDETYYFDAHTHLRVTTVGGLYKEDNWEADTGIQTFDFYDNP